MDPAYEYDAPTYVDFETVRLGLENDDEVDCWFGKFCLPSLSFFPWYPKKASVGVI